MKKLKLVCLIFAFFLLTQNIYGAKAKSSNKSSSKSSSKKTKVVVEDSFAEYPEEYTSIIKKSISLCESSSFEEAVSFLVSDEVLNYERSSYETVSANRSNLKRIDTQLEEIKKNAAEIIERGMKNDFFPGEEYFTQFSRNRNAIKKAGLNIQSAGSSYYPSWVSKTVLGVREDAKSGIIGALDLYMEKSISSKMNEFYELWSKECTIVSLCLNPKNIYLRKDYLEEAQNSVVRMAQIADSLASLNKLFLLLDNRENRAKTAELNDYDKSAKSMKTLLGDSKKFFAGVNSLQLNGNKVLVQPKDMIESVRQENDTYSAELAQTAKSFTNCSRIAAAAKKSESIRFLQTVKNIPVWKEFLEPYIAACNYIETDATAKAISLWIKTADYYSTVSIRLYEIESVEKNRIAELMKGDNGVYYPARARTQIESARTVISNDIRVLDDFKSRLNDAYIYRNNFSSQIEQLNSSTQKIKQLEVEINRIYEDTLEKIRIAQVAEKEVYYYFDQSAAFNRKDDFSRAFDMLQRTNAAYMNQIDALKNDGDIQISVFEKITKLRKEIIDKEQPRFVAQVRKIKNSARVSYYAGNFEQAISFVFEAENKRLVWSKLIDVTLDEDEELDRLKGFINTALAIKEGRDISPYDSKAMEMRQNFSIALKHFNNGKKLIETDRDAALAELSYAKEKVNQIKVYYPRNRDAGIMSLQIDKVIDPENFESVFKDKVSTLKGFDFSSRSPAAQENYSSLLDLYEINPKYSGLKKLLERAEIELGLKPKPVDSSNANAAAKLAKEAQQILNSAGRDDVLLSQAGELAKKAYELNPQNNQAVMIMDEIALRTGSGSAVVLSVSDEELYQKAMIDLQASRVFDANERLTKLLENKDNARSAKVLKLKKRIEAQL